jgi:hypothetical protein
MKELLCLSGGILLGFLFSAAVFLSYALIAHAYTLARIDREDAEHNLNLSYHK